MLIGLSAYSQEKPKKVRRGNSHLSITPGADMATMRSQDGVGTRVNFPQGFNWRLGLQFESPFAKGKWAFLIEPTYQHYKAPTPYPLKYSSLETPIGFRRYLPVSKASAIFINAMVVFDIPFTYSMELAPGLNFTSSNFKTNFAAGAGIAMRRLTLEYRFYSQRTAKDETDSFTFNYNKRSLILGYRLY